MIDPAFLRFSDALAKLLDLPGVLADETGEVRSHIYECTIETPIELDVSRDDDGQLVLGSVPPLYRVDTSFRPAFHAVRFTATAKLREVDDGR